MSRDRTPRTRDADGLRYALLRDLDSLELRPFGVLIETRDGARLWIFGPWDDRLKEVYDDFDAALTTCARSWLVTAVGREGSDHDLG